MMNKVFKKAAIAFAAATMTIAATSAVASANYTEYCTASSLSVRTAPTVNADKVGSYVYGQDVSVMESVPGTNWVKVSYNGMQRYACADYLSNSVPEGSSYSWLKTGSNVATKGEYRVDVKRDYLALRTSPTFDYSNEIAQLQNGTKVQLANQGEGTYWYVIVPSTGMHGYVNSNYLK